MPVDLSGYVTVGERLGVFREKYPEGSLQPFDPFNPFQIVPIGGATFIAYTAAAYRSADDPRPGIGVAWEPFPGKTNFTRDSELQNAETSAWGRAIVAALAADTQRGIASVEEIQARGDETDAIIAASAETLRNLRDGLRTLGEYPEAYKAAGYPAISRLDEMIGGTIRPMPAQAAHQAVELLREIATAEAATGNGADPASTGGGDSPSAVAAEPGLALADASALASAPCYLCGSSQSKRVTDAHDRVRCSNILGCEKRQRDLDQDDETLALGDDRNVELEGAE